MSRVRLAVRKNRPKASRKGDGYGNARAVLHAAQSQFSLSSLDGRTRLARTWQAVESELLSALGGDPTPQERILIGRVCFKLLRCHLYEAAFLSGNGKPQEEKYLALANSLRLDLQALGLERREKKVVDLNAYLQGASEQ